MRPVIISGGAGTRLWPLSRTAKPKQFCRGLVPGSSSSLFEEAFLRLKPLGHPWVLTVSELKVLTERALLDLGGNKTQAIYEPRARNTAPAMALLCARLQAQGLGREIVGVFPADQLVSPAKAFEKSVRLAESLVSEQGGIATIGVVPTFAATGYGYIKTAAGHRGLAFQEKPALKQAQEFIQSGGYLWNAGQFVFRVDDMAACLERHAPQVWRPIAEAFKVSDELARARALQAAYETVPSISIDYAVMEKLPEHICVPFAGQWNDLGSWGSVADLAEGRSAQDRDEEQRGEVATSGRPNGALTQSIAKKETDAELVTITVEAERNYISGRTDKTYALAGVSGLTVVDTPDALLIVDRTKTELVKAVVDKVKAVRPEQAAQHQDETRPWGAFEVLRDDAEFKAKVITVEAGAQISYQSHAKRSEHWVIVSGRGEVVLNDQLIPVQGGSYVHIPVGAKHRIRAASGERLRFVEVQTGTYFGEDDIVRYKDDYERA